MYHKRRRLQNYDYSNNGSYFITVCTLQRENLFWTQNINLNDVNIPLSDVGIFIKNCIEQTCIHVPSVSIDNYVIMPNHIHLIITLLDSDVSVSGIVHYLKSQTTKHLDYSIFQRSFHDHIIRNAAEYEKIWNYIEDNPRKWNEDKYYLAP